MPQARLFFARCAGGEFGRERLEFGDRGGLAEERLELFLVLAGV